MRMHYNDDVFKAVAEGEEAFVVTARDMTGAEKRTFRRKAR
jgi:hypothetical protein